METVAFIGLGNMGGPMATNLVRAGHSVTVYDRVEATMDTLAAAGARKAASAAEAIKGADCVISMLPASQHVKGLYCDPDGLFSTLPAGTLVVDCSTIDSAVAKEVAAAASENGILFMDAPVSGGTAGAAAGTLTFICGGTDAVFAQAKPILAHMGKNIFHAGDVGAGQMAKACNNMMLAIQMAGVSEALSLGIKNGLDPKVLSEIMKNSSGNNWALQVYNPVPGVMENAPASRNYEGGFMVDLMVKDLGLALQAAKHCHAETPMGQQANTLFSQHASKGNGQRDFSSIFLRYQQ
ncbi:3-hydroxyisobutyrate dehydrogenase [Salinispirillum sp. LH 10-3-1]|uniref:3-hydroxyisobutyrate dehydrogenase n=1 Tax=Salinispirillum sp. LH 10-3-1 TaxID=2952525 RepID=A0AB38YJT1_9GAMM